MSPTSGFREPWERESMSVLKPSWIISLYDFLYFSSKRRLHFLQFNLF